MDSIPHYIMTVKDRINQRFRHLKQDTGCLAIDWQQAQIGITQTVQPIVAASALLLQCPNICFILIRTLPIPRNTKTECLFYKLALSATLYTHTSHSVFLGITCYGFFAVVVLIVKLVGTFKCRNAHSLLLSKHMIELSNWQLYPTMHLDLIPQWAIPDIRGTS